MKPELGILVRIGPPQLPVIIARTHSPVLLRQVIESALADARGKMRHGNRGDVVSAANARQQVTMLAALIEGFG